MHYVNPEALVSTGWLAEHMEDSDLVIVDASFFVPGGTAPAKEKYAEGHIPASIYFDINKVADPDAEQDHTVPSAAVFGAKIGALGIGNGSFVIAYDAMGGGCAAARVWWMFKAFGHGRVAVLDGGFAKWKAEGRPLTQEITEKPAKTFAASQEALDQVLSKADILANIDKPAYQVVDARSAGRFAGSDPEPRAGLKSGHIPGSRNIPFGALFNADNKTFKPASSLAADFTDAGVDLSKPMATTCGSGVTACTVALAAHLLGKNDVAIYDGSWVDWGSDPDTPVTTGTAD